MTEQEWLAATDPTPMLEFLQNKASDRKLRLFGCACCRLSWDTFTDARLREAVGVAEGYADRAVPETHRATTEALVLEAYDEEISGEIEYLASPVVDVLSLIANRRYVVVDASRCSASVAHWALGGDIYTNYRVFEHDLEAEHTLFVHDIFGNPFCPVVVDPSWLTTDVRILADGIYHDHAPDRLPILADALQDAGCDNDEILNHCRQPSEHVRGCWVVDLLTGRT